MHFDCFLNFKITLTLSDLMSEDDVPLQYRLKRRRQTRNDNVNEQTALQIDSMDVPNFAVYHSYSASLASRSHQEENEVNIEEEASVLLSERPSFRDTPDLPYHSQQFLRPDNVEDLNAGLELSALQSNQRQTRYVRRSQQSQEVCYKSQ